MSKELKYRDITEKIIGCAMKVHQKMKNGYNEIIYQRCLSIEFTRIGLKFLEEVEMPIYYDEFLVGKRKVDFLIENKIVVEIKAVSELTDAHLSQAINYLEIHKMETGLIINFGYKSLQFRRLINQQKLYNPDNPINH
jgi:GxxExxY protein